VHELHPPSEGNQMTELDVLLFHGLQLTDTQISDAWRSTWTNDDGVCWPRDWLPSDIRKVRIFSVSYNAHVVTSPYDHVSEIAHNVSQTLTCPRYKITSLSLSNCDAWAIAVISLTNISSD
jgi:hypothetical protein